jgi:hypothetical protein
MVAATLNRVNTMIHTILVRFRTKRTHEAPEGALEVLGLFSRADESGRPESRPVLLLATAPCAAGAYPSGTDIGLAVAFGRCGLRSAHCGRHLLVPLVGAHATSSALSCE